jgi:hypothetical protein
MSALFLVAVVLAAPVELEVARDTRLEVSAAWAPLSGGRNGFLQRYARYYGQLSPAAAKHVYRGEELAALLPGKPLEVGEVYALEPDAALVFLRQLHPGVAPVRELKARGAWGCLRAVSDRWAELTLRVHAELKLAEGVYYTPAQFAARVVVDRAKAAVARLEISVPTEHPLNVDLEVLAEGKVDIAFTPRMELIGGPLEPVERIAWKEQVELENARAALAVKFYPFKQIHWVPFQSALDEARRQRRPIHAVMLWGVIDDQSC